MSPRPSVRGREKTQKVSSSRFHRKSEAMAGVNWEVMLILCFEKEGTF